MASLNKVMLIGNLTRDPEIRRTAKGTAVAEIALAMNRKFTGTDGKPSEETTYVDVTLWARQAELAEQYLRKGSPVFIEGRLQIDTWEDKATRQKRSRLKVVGEVMQFLGGKPINSPQPSPQSSEPRREKQEDKWAADWEKTDVGEDDIPF